MIIYITVLPSSILNGMEGLGGTAIVAISMIQTLFIGDIVVFLSRLVLERNDTAPYSKTIVYVFGGMLVLFVIYNYRKYNGSYNKFRSFWKEETRKERFVKGGR